MKRDKTNGDITWLHTRSCKYNLSAGLEPTLSVMGYNVLTWTLLSDHGNFRRSKCQVWSTHTWEKKRPTESDIQLCYNSWWTDRYKQTTCSVQFHLYRQPKPSLFISCNTKCSSAWYPSNSAEHWTSHRVVLFSSVSPAWFLCGKPKMPFVPLCCCYIAILLCCSLATNPLYAFLLDFITKLSHLWCVWMILVRKCFKWYTLSSGVKPSFLKPGFHMIVRIIRIVPVVSKKCSDDRDVHMETLPRRSQTTRTTETTSIAWIELSSIRTIGTIV